MSSLKKKLKNLMEWLLCIAFSAIIINILIIPFYRPAAWLNRDNAATKAIWMPNSFVIKGDEGYGVSKVDSRGYLNPEGILEQKDSCILVMGSSHTQGKEVFEKDKYVTYINNQLEKENSNRAAYNIACDGYILSDMVKGFKAALQEFPQADAVILELRTLGLSKENFENAMEQTQYEENSNGDRLWNTLGVKSKFKYTLQEVLPLVRYLSFVQFDRLQLKPFENAFGIKKLLEKPKEVQISDSDEEYVQRVSEMLYLMRQSFNGQIIIIYHPDVAIQKNGGLMVATDAKSFLLEKICAEANISYINVEKEFINQYENYHLVPYGFWNTQMGKGHLNKYGHRILGEALWRELSGGNSK